MQHLIAKSNHIFPQNEYICGLTTQKSFDLMVRVKDCLLDRYLAPRRGQMNKFKILIVDDNGSFRQIFKQTLQESLSSIAIEEATDGEEALHKVDAFLPNLIFMDIRLPGENGLELTKKIKTTHPNITILIVTSYDIPEYRDAAVRCGADGFFGKATCDTKELEKLIKSCQKV